MKIAELNEKQFKALIGDVIEEKLREILDPDYGLELREDFVKEIREIRIRSLILIFMRCRVETQD
ncbi:MAG: hypothetical protein HZC13_04660 [Nitrospirae bacterium]|nr:hypothetical protein [Nitrospirota bacterium]MBI5097376.1 hypothetical protein [Nitrospirota bacterium]